MALTPAEFVAHWNASTLNEIQGYQQHFLQLCEIVGFNPNAPAVLTGPALILFESNVTKAEGGSGRACYLALEYKTKLRAQIADASRPLAIPNPVQPFVTPDALKSLRKLSKPTPEKLTNLNPQQIKEFRRMSDALLINSCRHN